MPHSLEEYRLIVDTWKEATLTEELADLLAGLWQRLGHLGVAGRIALWRLERENRASTIASVGRDGNPVAVEERAVREDGIREWRDLSSQGRSTRLGSARGGALSFLSPPNGVEGEGLLVPIRDEGAKLAALVLWRQAAYTDADRRLLEALGAPVAAALRLHDERHKAVREREALEADRRALLQRLDRDDITAALIGADSGLRDVVTRAEQVAPTDAPVLLLGETGAGKEVVARAIHGWSRRAAGPIVRVNCGAIPLGLIDSELFGHEKGAFTGAITVRKGWFERADGGTLFLDEIGELPLDAQVRLLRILQDGVFERVGAQRSLKVDVRIVAATHRNLQQMVDSRRFREDLWYRLNVFPITIPPLRERREDIPALAAHFAARAGIRIGGAALAIAPSDLDVLVRYDWPGNVRELAAVIERAVILGNGHQVVVRAALGVGDQRPPREEELPMLTTLDEAMARHIERALRACSGRIEGRGGAAALLRINPHTLRARMRKLGVDAKRIRADLAPEDDRSPGPTGDL